LFTNDDTPDDAPADDKPDVVDTPDDSNDTPDGDEFEEKKFSQKELERALAKRLKRQEDQFAKKYADYDTIKADAEAYRKVQDEKSTDAERWERELNSLKAALTDKDEKLNKLERAALITDLAAEKGLPKSFWKRVSGETPEDIEEDIDSIIKDLGVEPEGDGKSKTPKKPVKRTVYGGGGENEDPDPDIDQIVSKIPRGPQFRVDKPRSYK